MSLEKVVEYIKEANEKRFDEISSRLDKIDEKVTDILLFKWQIIGGSIVLSVIVTMGFQVISLVWSK